MSTQPPLVRLACDALAREAVSVKPATARERALAVLALTRAIEADARRRNLRGATAVAVFAVAASVAAFIGARAAHVPAYNANAPVVAAAAPPVTVAATRESGDVRIWTGGAVLPLEGEASPLGVDDRIVSDADGSATLRLSTGTLLQLGRACDLTVLVRSAEQRVFALRAGSVHADVANLGLGQRFAVKTPDAEVESSGGSFRVAVVSPRPSCGLTTPTRVLVQRGAVVVRTDSGEVALHGGDDWPPGCLGPPAAPPQ